MFSLLPITNNRSRRAKCRPADGVACVEHLETRELLSATATSPLFLSFPQANSETSQRGVMITTDALVSNYGSGSANTLRELGINLLRVELVVDPVGPVNSGSNGTFDQQVANYRTWLDGEISKIKSVDSQLRQDGIKIIIDMHDPFGGPTWGEPGHQQLFTDSKVRQQCVEDWGYIAEKFKDTDIVSGFDLLNEPKRGSRTADPASWNDLVVNVIDKIRATGNLNTNRMIIIESAGGNPLNLKHLQAERFKGPVAFSFHFYEPMAFSSYEVERYFHYRYRTTPESGKYLLPDSSNERLPDNWKQQVEKELQEVVEFQRTYNVQVYVGEFSASLIPASLINGDTDGLTVSSEGRKRDVARYLSYVSGKFEENGWDWTYHAYGESDLWDAWKSFGNREELWNKSNLKNLWSSNLQAEAIQTSINDGELTIRGTSRADNILIYQADGCVIVDQIGLNATRLTFPSQAIQSIRVAGRGGNDTIQNESDLPMEAFGGAGTDILFGGTSNDKLHGGTDDDKLYGRDGDDRLFGDDGNDLLAPGPGRKQLSDGGEGDSDRLVRNKGERTVRRGIEITRTRNSTRDGQLSVQLLRSFANDTILTIDAEEDVREYRIVASGSDVIVYADSEPIYQGLLSELTGFAFAGSDANDRIVNQTSLPLTADGGYGDDTIVGGSGADELIGGPGNDVLYGGGGNDNLQGGEGLDHLFGEAGMDWMDGGSGDDQLYGQQGDDQLFGGDGGDVLYGGDGNDILNGMAGNDALFGEGGNDRVDGGDGNDWVRGDAGNDVVHGGAGNDRVEGGDGDDRLFGGDGGDFLAGDSGDDTMEGGAGGDEMYGGQGRDTMYGQEGNNAMFGEWGHDALFGGDGNDYMTGYLGNDYLDGGNGDDTLRGDDGNDTIDGGAGNDFLEGGADDDTLRGGSGNDSLYGNGGNDVLQGGSGNDNLFGGRGDDRLYGDGGTNYLDGGDGEDQMNGYSDTWWSRRINRFRGWIWG